MADENDEEIEDTTEDTTDVENTQGSNPYEGIFPEKSPEEVFAALRDAEPQLPDDDLGLPEAELSQLEDVQASDVTGDNGEPILPPTDMDPQRRDGKTPLHLPILPYLKLWAWDESRAFRQFIVHGVLSSSVSSSSSSPSPSSTSPPSPSVAPSSKMAIVPVRVNGVEKNIGWFCSEEPEARFFDTLEIPVPRFRRRVSVELPQEFIQSVEPVIKVISVLSPEVPACASGGCHRGRVIVSFRKPWFSRRVKKLIVRIQGKRKDSPERWKRFSDEVMERNNAFWGQAYGQ